MEKYYGGINMNSEILRLFGVIIICLSVSSGIYSQNIGLVDILQSEQVITVGGPGADLPGFNSKAIQIAFDAIRTRGDGTVKLNSGTYKISGPVRLSGNTSLIGSGETTILRKCDGIKTSFIIDTDRGILKAVVKDASGFHIDGETHDITTVNNIIRPTDKGNQATAIFVGSKSSEITATDNMISGHEEIVYEK